MFGVGDSSRGSGFDFDLSLATHTDSINLNSAVIEFPQEVKREEPNPLLSQLWEAQKQTIANQHIIINKLIELEQRCYRIEQMVSDKIEYLPEKMAVSSEQEESQEQASFTEHKESTKMWFEKRFVVEGCAVNSSELTNKAKKYSLQFPIINKNRQASDRIEIRLKWIQNDSTLEDNQTKILDRISNQMKIYRRKPNEESLDFQSKISPESIKLQFLKHSSQVIVTVNHRDFPLSFKEQSFLCIGVSDKNDSIPAILLKDIFHISKIVKKIESPDYINKILIQVNEYSEFIKYACWYKEFVTKCKEKGIPLAENTPSRKIVIRDKTNLTGIKRNNSEQSDVFEASKKKARKDDSTGIVTEQQVEKQTSYYSQQPFEYNSQNQVLSFEGLNPNSVSAYTLLFETHQQRLF